MNSRWVRSAGIVVLVSAAIMLLLAVFAAVGNAEAFGLLLARGAFVVIGAALILALLAPIFALFALRAYLNRFAGYVGADVLIRSLLACFIAGGVLGAIGFALGGGSVVFIVLGIVGVVGFMLYFALAFRIKKYAASHDDAPARRYALFALVHCFSVVLAVFLSMVAAASPPAIGLVTAVGWFSSVLQWITWIALGVLLVAGANKMRAKGL